MMVSPHSQRWMLMQFDCSAGAVNQTPKRGLFRTRVSGKSCLFLVMTFPPRKSHSPGGSNSTPFRFKVGRNMGIDAWEASIYLVSCSSGHAERLFTVSQIQNTLSFFKDLPFEVSASMMLVQAPDVGSWCRSTGIQGPSCSVLKNARRSNRGCVSQRNIFGFTHTHIQWCHQGRMVATCVPARTRAVNKVVMPAGKWEPQRKYDQTLKSFSLNPAESRGGLYSPELISTQETKTKTPKPHRSF